jgi:hypothetical protein
MISFNVPIVLPMGFGHRLMNRIVLYNSGSDTYTKTITPNSFYNRSNIGRIGFLIKAKDGTGDKKSQDILAEVGVFGNAKQSNREWSYHFSCRWELEC